MTKSAIILGSGIWKMLARLRRRGKGGRGGVRVSGGEVRRTPFGPSRPIFEVALPGGRRAIMLTRHGERGYDIGAWAVNYRANLWALKDLGADHVLATCACGAIDPRLAVGEFLVPHDVLDKTTGRVRTFFQSSGLGVLRMGEPFCPALRSALAKGLAAARVPHRLDGVCACTDGPRLETRAEVRALAAEGADIVGMTLCPEFALARELQMCYAAVAFVVNPAEGAAPRPYRPDVLFEGMATAGELEAGDRAAARLPEILAAAIASVSARRRCHCRQAMRRYVQRGDIGPDFRTWLGPPRAGGG